MGLLATGGATGAATGAATGTAAGLAAKAALSGTAAGATGAALTVPCGASTVCVLSVVPGGTTATCSQTIPGPACGAANAAPAHNAVSTANLFTNNFLLLQKVFNRTESLSGSMIVLNEGETNKALAKRAEPYARRYSDKSFFEQQLREFE